VKLPVMYESLTIETRRKAKNAYAKLQDYKCWYCQADITGPPKNKPLIDWSLFPQNFLKYPVHLQHDHETGLTEGVVHAYCNAVLWQYEGR
jgi:hypothetical protein